MKRSIAKEFKEPLDKVRKAFKKLREKNIYAYPKALDFDSSGCQSLIHEEMKKNSDWRGGIYWNLQNEEILDLCPILHLGYIPRFYQTKEEMLKKALEIAQEVHDVLTETGLEILWNKCVCNTIGIILSENIEDDLLEEMRERPCFCEKIWEKQFQQFAEERLGKSN